MYYVVMLGNQKFVRDVSDNRFIALFTTFEAAQRVADHSGEGAHVVQHMPQDNPFAHVTCFAE